MNNAKIKKIFLITAFLLLPDFVLAGKIGQLDFEQNLIDSYGNLSIQDGNGVSYVAGHTGYAARTSHHGTDSGGYDDFVVSWTIPSSGEYYIKAYIKYEDDYFSKNFVVGQMMNVKWMWLDAANGHWELIWQYGNSFDFYPANGATWDDGTINTDGESWSATRGVWHKVEMYFKRSTGESNTNLDGAFWMKIDDATIYSKTGMKTGSITNTNFPSIKAISSTPMNSGEGWWQLDDYEVWDGMPDEEPGGTTAPNVPSGLTVS